MADTTETSEDFEALLAHLSTHRGFDFTAYKRSTLRRRTRMRMQALKLESYTDYIDYLEVDPTEFTRFFDTMLINVTGFFRDPDAWAVIRNDVIPAICAAKPDSEPIRVWCAGCSSGEEAYTLAMLFMHELGPFSSRVKIYATDVDLDALSVARAAVYNERSMTALPEDFAGRYFDRLTSGQYQLKREVRRMVIFGRHDLLSDAPISRIDLLTCRNALMYFNAESQARILARFFFALREGGFLMLGKAETLLTRSAEVTPINLKLRVFLKTGNEGVRTRLLAASQGRDAPAEDEGEVTSRIREAAFEVDPVAQVVVDLKGDLGLANDAARRMFGLRDRDIGRPMQNYELSYRPVDLRSLYDTVTNELRSTVIRETSWPLSDNSPRWIDTQAIPLTDDAGLIGVKFIFRDITGVKQLQADLEASHSEIETAYEELQFSNEELETTNEELHSTVEELETTNEELQSTNEELETMNEELHSANEELEAVNLTMMDRTTELDRSNAHLNAILGSLVDGVIVLDRSLEIQIWNRQSTEQWGLRADEVIGQHILNLDIGLDLESIIGVIRQCLAGRDAEPLVVSATNRRGRTVDCTVTARTLRLTPNTLDGVILVIADREVGQSSDR